MNTAFFYSLIGLALAGLGFQAFFSRSHLLQKILALNVSSSGIFLIMVSSGFHAAPFPDPVLHALVLTGIVIAVSTTAFGLALAARFRSGGEKRVPPDRGGEEA